MNQRKKPELLMPASNLEVLHVAIRYGADAVYIGGELYGLRAKAKNFSREDMETGIAYAHERGKNGNNENIWLYALCAGREREEGQTVRRDSFDPVMGTEEAL